MRGDDPLLAVRREQEHMEIREHLRRQCNELRNILETLVDLQNGCPLPKYHDEWNATMRAAYVALGRPEWEDR